MYNSITFDLKEIGLSLLMVITTLNSLMNTHTQEESEGWLGSSAGGGLASSGTLNRVPHWS